ncbi:polysaccharide pyruvyl transferase [Nitzschia inconspicua]|uniref:Polysaccharide pyruvyl transferase n=1 Tax=Nitzschia inconspicua TaxID=303405 RepID=A0A9K3PTP9_9STRA|nr:polysaccharide pyruvyl transferase [Nitzschia inconspicua]KAG7359395.1 polysaccharide pyruvyl transferase [Nitzschia inconspicua]
MELSGVSRAGCRHPKPTSGFADSKNSLFQIRHSVLTRFMVGQGNQPALARARFELFKTFCLPTMVSQTSQNYFWLVLIDPGLSQDILQEMTSLLQTMPSQNAFLIVTNNTEWASDGLSHYNKKAKGYGVNLRTIAEEFQHGRLDIRTGNTDTLLGTLQHNNGGQQSSLPSGKDVPLKQNLILVETLLDADDGLHRLAIEYMQKDILERTYPQQQQLLSQKITPTLDLTWWILCASDHIEWHHREIFKITVEEYAEKGISDGMVGRREMPQECISAGFTRVGFLDVAKATRLSCTFPKNAQNNHFQTHKTLKPCQRDTQKHCYFRSFMDFPGALRSRSITSDSMSHLDPDVNLSKKSKYLKDSKFHLDDSDKLWKVVADDFSIRREQVLQLSKHLYENRVSILLENERSRCRPGFPCVEHSKTTISKLKEMIVPSGSQTPKKKKKTWAKKKPSFKLVSKEDSKTKIVQPKTIRLHEIEKPAIKVRHQCIEAIRERQKNVISDVVPFFHDMIGQRALLVNPAYHSNVGDHMITLGEIELLRRLGVKIPEEIEQCRYSGQDLIPYCKSLKWWKEKNYQAGGRPALLHGGGNWGDLWRKNQNLRIQSLEIFLQKNFTILGMPQSLYYRDEDLKKQDADRIEAILSTFHGTVAARPTFLWREQFSYDEAVELYPSAQNVLMPDIAFQLGPYQPAPVNDSNAVDVVVFLRKDHESLESKHRNAAYVRSILNSLVGEEKSNSTTFKIVDWNDRLEIFDSDNILFTETAIQMLSMGRVLVCDRLHASILAYLSGIPFVYIDQLSGKISKTLDVALRIGDGCLDGQKSNFARAMNLTQALDMAMDFLENDRFR